MVKEKEQECCEVDEKVCCCEKYYNQKKAEGKDVGGANVCCNGKVVICVYAHPRGWGGKEAEKNAASGFDDWWKAQAGACTQAHEQQHLDNGDLTSEMCKDKTPEQTPGYLAGAEGKRKHAAMYEADAECLKQIDCAQSPRPHICETERDTQVRNFENHAERLRDQAEKIEQTFPNSN